MIDVRHPPHPPVEPATAPTAVPGRHSRLALDMRELAEDMVGRLDRDELTLDEEEPVADLLDEAVAAVLPRLCEALEAELASRVASLPLHARVALAGARRRRQLGLD